MDFKKNALSILLLIVLLVSFLSLVGCEAEEAIEAEDEPEEVTEPDEEVEEPEEKVLVEILGGRPGSVSYVIGHALTEFIRQDSDKVEAVLRSTGGITDNSMMFIDNQDAYADSAMTIITYDPPTLDLWKEGGVDDPLIIGKVVTWPYTFVTFDEDINNMTDFEGKTIGMGRRAATPWIWGEMLLEEAGVIDNVDVVHGGPGDLADHLRDGTVDVAQLLVDWIYPDDWAPSSSIQELEAINPIYYVDMDFEHVKAVYDHWDSPPIYTQIPAGSMGETQDRDIATIPVPTALAVFPDMDESIVYEVTRIFYERASELAFKDYHGAGAGISADYMVSSFYETEEERKEIYHPGALKYFEDHGIELLQFPRFAE